MTRYQAPITVTKKLAETSTANCHRESEQAHRCLRISGASPLVLVKRGRAAAPMARIATIPIWMYSTPAKARG